ncbi:MAG: AAA family ATPase [Leptolyngbyaceae cyanobacterium]
MDEDTVNPVSRAYSDAELRQYNQTKLAELENTLRYSQGEFSLIIVACDYHRLRHLVNQHLVDAGLATVMQLPREFVNLRETIQLAIAEPTPPALLIVGLDYLTKAHLRTVLQGFNMGRDDFRQQFPFPLVLWMNRRVQQQFAQFAPDFRSFSPAAIQFTLPAAELLHSLQVGTDQLFRNILTRGGDRELSTLSIRLIGSDALRSELEFAIQDLAAQNVVPEPQLQASLDFLQGREAHSRLEMATARDRYEDSLAFWQSQVEAAVPTDRPDSLTAVDRRAVLWLHLGLWWRSYAVVQRVTYNASLRQARRYFEQLIEHFRDRDQTVHLAQFIHALAEVRQKQRDWVALEDLANEGIRLHQETQDAVRLARDRGFLAEVALIKEDWLTAQDEANRALQILETAENFLVTDDSDIDLANALEIAKSFQRGWYRFLLGEAQMHLGQSSTALQYLEAARWETDPDVDLTLHLRVLNQLIHHHFELGDYWEAFNVKQDRRQVEYRYSLRAFIGAGAVQPHRQLAKAKTFDEVTQAAVAAEIRASGRLRDVEALAQRLQENSHAVVIVHGPSGVGKSSILTAGLLPMLRHPGSAIAGNLTVPLLVQTYGNWRQTLDAALDEALAPWPAAAPTPAETAAPTTASLMAKLRQGIDDKNRAFVLIFDQFEEFFFDQEEPGDRYQLYEFLGQCIDKAFVKVVLALREDYLHHLLEAERIINQVVKMRDQDLLSREQRYALANFTPAAAEGVIRQLTSAAQYPLPDDLIHRLVGDLSAVTGDVRPIELQVVGAQLQREEINTLAQYEALGDMPKEKLVQDYLAYVVHDCGPPNERLAWVVLYLLTEEDREQRLFRPLKTRDELEYELALLEMPFNDRQLTMVLSILVGSGLAFEIPEEPEARYQLVHDYLVRYVRDVQTPGLMAELEEARAAAQAAAAAQEVAEVERDKLAEANAVLAAANAEAEDVVDRAQRQAGLIGTVAAAGVIGAIVLASVFGTLARNSNLMAEEATQDAEAATELAEAEKARADEQEALVAELDDEAAALEQRIEAADEELKTAAGRAAEAEQQAADAEQRREAAVANLAQVQQQAEASERTRREAEALAEQAQEDYDVAQANLKAAQREKAAVESEKLDVDVQRQALETELLMASGLNFEALQTATKMGRQLQQPEALVAQMPRAHSVPLAISTTVGAPRASIPGSTRLRAIAWLRETIYQPDWIVRNTLSGHDSEVIGVSFSPDGETVASASRDGTVKLWNRQGQALKTLSGHDDEVIGVSFSPNGETVASASFDGTVKLWNRQGQALQTLSGHDSEVIGVSFSPDGETVASASWDGTVRLWSRQGQELQTLSGHDSAVYGVSFSPDGETVASASLDGTVILWNFDLDDLLDKSCDWLSDYLQNPAVPMEEKQALCPDRVAPVQQAASPAESPLGSAMSWMRQWFNPS